MANEIRLRANNISGTVSDNPLLIGATTINSPGFVDLPTVGSTNHLILILDPLEVNGQAEIVQVTAHSAASSVVTVIRGFETTTPRQHPFGTTWFHGPVVSDWNYTDRGALSTNRPTSGISAGQMIYETDTKKLMVYNGTDWAPNQAGGQLGYASTTTPQTLTAAADLTGLTTTVTVATNRRIKITGHVLFENANATARRVFLQINEGASGLVFATGNVNASGNDNRFQTVVVTHVLTPTPGSHTYKLLGNASGFNVIANSSGDGADTGFILVEDIGAA